MVSSKCQVIETKLVNAFMWRRAEKTRGGKYEGIFSDVVENKWVARFEKICMKRKGVSTNRSEDVDEKTGIARSE